VLKTEEREERQGQARTREQGHDGWKVLDVKMACLCKHVAQRALGGREDGTRVDLGEGRGVNVLEEVTVVVGHHGEAIESRGG
jgi:hypothetical protein